LKCQRLENFYTDQIGQSAVWPGPLVDGDPSETGERCDKIPSGSSPYGSDLGLPRVDHHERGGSIERIQVLSFDNCIKSMADNCRQVYEEMTGQTVEETATSRIDLPQSAPRFKAAMVIPYENTQDLFEGRFILGFNDDVMAVKLADRIAGFAGIPAVDALDDVATEILFEFMNTVAGKVVSAWEPH